MSITLESQVFKLFEEIEEAANEAEASCQERARKSTSRFLLHVRRFQEANNCNWSKLFEPILMPGRIKNNQELVKSYLKPLKIYLEMYPKAKSHPRRFELGKSILTFLQDYQAKMVQKKPDSKEESKKQKALRRAIIVDSGSEPCRKSAVITSQPPVQ